MNNHYDQFLVVLVLIDCGYFWFHWVFCSRYIFASLGFPILAEWGFLYQMYWDDFYDPDLERVVISKAEESAIKEKEEDLHQWSRKKDRTKTIAHICFSVF